jgi:hypothetical protein
MQGNPCHEATGQGLFESSLKLVSEFEFESLGWAASAGYESLAGGSSFGLSNCWVTA